MEKTDFLLGEETFLNFVVSTVHIANRLARHEFVNERFETLVFLKEIAVSHMAVCDDMFF